MPYCKSDLSLPIQFPHTISNNQKKASLHLKSTLSIVCDDLHTGDISSSNLMSEPDLVVPNGPRALLSLVGIVLIVGGVWRADRMWVSASQQAEGTADNTS